MPSTRFARLVLLSAALAAAVPYVARAQFEPKVGQAGKDVVWVPTPDRLVEKMLDMAKVTPQDYVVDLGSGDGRNVIAAAKRGARSLGVEYNPEMVALSKRLAAEAGVADKATFVEGDMFERDFSQATVLALFLLPSNLARLSSKFLNLKPGTRIVLNAFGIDGWTAEQTETIEGCQTWCTALLYLVPARVQGTWQLSQGELTLRQDAQKVSGSLLSEGMSVAIETGRLRGDDISFTAGDTEYTGRVTGDTMEGRALSKGRSRAWSGTRVSSR